MSYPFDAGYCQVSDITARILAGQWDPTNPNDGPASAQVSQWISESSALIDSVLARNGYTIPLVAVPGGAIAPQAWLILQNICAAYVCHHVEQSRHGSTDKQGDSNASTWLQYADDMLARIESGADNLTVWGLAGGFEPDIDPAKAIQLGNRVDSTTNILALPMFTRGMKF